MSIGLPGGENHMPDNPLAKTATRESLLRAILPHVLFDGWSAPAFAAAARDAGIAPDLARVLAPRGATDLAADYHRQGDRRMVERLLAADLSGQRIRDRITTAVLWRLEEADPEAVRRGMALFALPIHAAEGAALVWATADAIWTALGDSSADASWYTRRATLAAVWSATVLYWLGDGSEGHAETRAFLDRRIDGVMRFEKAKKQLRDAPLLGRLIAGPLNPLNRLRPPARPDDLPGRMAG